MNLSVIIPAYNVGPVLERCLQSLRRQRRSDFECIVIDDASTDETPALLRRFAAEDPRLRLLTNPKNHGPSTCRNLGLSLATGRYVTFVDADDWLDETAFELWLAFAEAHDLDYCFGPHDEYLERQQRTHHKNPGLSSSHILSEADLFAYVDRYVANPCAHFGLVHCWGRLYRRDLIVERSLRFNPALSQMEDVAFNFDYLRHCRRVGYLDASLYTHRIPAKGSLGSQKGLEPDFDRRLLQAIAPLETFVQERMRWDPAQTRQRIDHFYASMIIVSILRLARPFFRRPSLHRYQRIHALVVAATTQAAINRYRPAKRDSRFIGVAIRQRWTPIALLICLLKRVTRLAL